MVRITKEFKFEMAHALHGYDGLCKNIHGHSYKLCVTVKGKIKNNKGNSKDGMVLDFDILKSIVKPEIINKYGHDYKLVFVGDATMSPYEIAYPGGSIEHWNEESGAIWIQRILKNFRNAVWLNPEPFDRWEYTPSIKLTNELMNGRMFPLTLSGLSDAIKELH